MRQQSRHCSRSASVQYVGPTFVKVQRHNDILAIVGDIFSDTDNDEDETLENTRVDESQSSCMTDG